MSKNIHLKKSAAQPWMLNSKEDLAECPFDKNHIVLKSRLITHICKCRRQYTGDDFTTCPFNASHAVLKKELQAHADSCPDRRKIDSHLFVIEEDIAKKILENAKVDVPPAEELWDSGPSEPYSYLDVINKKISKLPILRGPVCGSKAKKKKFIKEEESRHFIINRAASRSSGITEKEKEDEEIDPSYDEEQEELDL